MLVFGMALITILFHKASLPRVGYFVIDNLTVNFGHAIERQFESRFSLFKHFTDFQAFIHLNDGVQRNSQMNCSHGFRVYQVVSIRQASLTAQEDRSTAHE